MGTMYWVRVVLMVLVFGAVVWAIRYLNTRKPTMSPIAQAAMGTSGGSSTPLTICPTRVVSVDADGFRLVQENSKWTRDSKGVKSEVNGPAVEEWLAVLCKTTGDKVETGEAFVPTLQLSYVSGEPSLLEHSPTGEWRWKGQRYISKALDEAMRTLYAVPASGKSPGKN